MKIKPLFNRILAKKIKKEQKSAGGIEIFQEEEQIEKAQVLEIGSTAQNCGISIGDTIFFEPHVTAELNLGTDELILICVEDILALENENTLKPTNHSEVKKQNSLQIPNILLNQQVINFSDQPVGNSSEEVI